MRLWLLWVVFALALAGGVGLQTGHAVAGVVALWLASLVVALWAAVVFTMAQAITRVRAKREGTRAPFNGCAVCREFFPDWMCEIQGCPPAP